MDEPKPSVSPAGRRRSAGDRALLIAAVSLFALMLTIGVVLIVRNQDESWDDGNGSLTREDVGGLSRADDDDEDEGLPSRRIDWATPEAIAVLAPSSDAFQLYDPDAWLVLRDGHVELDGSPVGPLAPGDRYPSPPLRAVRNALMERAELRDARISTGLAIPADASYGTVLALARAIQEAGFLACVAVRDAEGRAVCTGAAFNDEGGVAELISVEVTADGARLRAYASDEALVVPQGGSWAEADAALLAAAEDRARGEDFNVVLVAAEESTWRDVVAAHDSVRQGLARAGVPRADVRITLTPPTRTALRAGAIHGQFFLGAEETHHPAGSPLVASSARARSDRARVVLGDGPVDVGSLPPSACLAVERWHDEIGSLGEGCIPIGRGGADRVTATIAVELDPPRVELSWSPHPELPETCISPTTVVPEGRPVEHFVDAASPIFCIVRGIELRDRPEDEQLRVEIGPGTPASLLVDVLDELRCAIEAEGIDPDLVAIEVVARAAP